jgi:polygalacturonase
MKSNVNLFIDEGVTLLGSHDEKEFPKTLTRAGGIQMYWHAAMISLMGQKNVKVSGRGTINGRGEYWWYKFWSSYKDYEKRGLRWVADYDISRPHMIQVHNSENVIIEDLTLKYSQFWTVHVVFSKHVTVRGLTIRNNMNGKTGPSTDGINMDSSTHCLVEDCDVDTNDDNFSFKSGINADGLKVGIPIQYTVFRNCISRRGHGGITIGSDASGGVHHVLAYNIKMFGTHAGIRFKSARIRGTITSDVHIHNIEMDSVGKMFEFNLDWFPDFSYPNLPDTLKNVPDFWKVIAEKVPEDIALPHFRDIRISNVTGKNGSKIFDVIAYPEAPLEDFTFKNVKVSGKLLGEINHVKNWQFENVSLQDLEGNGYKLDNQNITMR